MQFHGLKMPPQARSDISLIVNNSFVTVTFLKVKFQFKHQFRLNFGKQFGFTFYKKPMRLVVGWQIIASRQKPKLGTGVADGGWLEEPCGPTAPAKTSRRTREEEKEFSIKFAFSLSIICANFCGLKNWPAGLNDVCWVPFYSCRWLPMKINFVFRKHSAEFKWNFWLCEN